MNKKDFVILVLIAIFFTVGERSWTSRYAPNSAPNVCVITKHEMWNTNLVVNVTQCNITNTFWETNIVTEFLTITNVSWETNIVTIFKESEVSDGIPLPSISPVISVDLKDVVPVNSDTNFDSISSRLKQLLDKYERK